MSTNVVHGHFSIIFHLKHLSKMETFRSLGRSSGLHPIVVPQQAPEVEAPSLFTTSKGVPSKGYK
jgi:hypothetical protein